MFISTRLMDDRFSVAFEFYINVAHAFVEQAGVAESFADLVWKQAEDRVRGETSLDAFETRKAATTPGPQSEKARNEYLTADLRRRDRHLHAGHFSRRGLLRPARA